MSEKCRIGLAVVFGLALSGCQTQPDGERSVLTNPQKPKPNFSKVAETEERKRSGPEPVFIDLGPIETIALSPFATFQSSVLPVMETHKNPEPLPLHTVLSPAESVRAIQLASSGGSETDLRVEQPSGPLNDRCDPAYWGGAVPPVSLGCDNALQAHSDRRTHRAPQPGTYVRINQKSPVRLDDAALIARKLSGSEKETSEDALGAVLILGSSGPASRGRASLLYQRSDEDVDPAIPVEGDAVSPSVRLPGS